MSSEKLQRMVASLKSRLITGHDLVETVFHFLGLEIFQEFCRNSQELTPAFVSRPFVAHKVGGNFLTALEEDGFKFERAGNGGFRLKTGTPEEGWDFYTDVRGKVELAETVLNLRVVGRIETSGKGITITPRITGPCFSTSAVLPQFRLLRVMSEFQHPRHPIIDRIIKSRKNGAIMWKNVSVDGNQYRVIPKVERTFDDWQSALIEWGDVGLDSACSMPQLFYQFAGRREKVRRLVNSRILSPFDPSPFVSNAPNFEMFYVSRRDQPDLLRIWANQLADLKAAL